MTHDEKKALAELFTKCGMQPPYPTADEMEVIVRWGLALSVKLEEREKEWRAFEEREAACCPEDVGFDEYIRVLRVKLEEAQVDIYGWKQVCEGKEYQYLALTAKLEEAQTVLVSWRQWAQFVFNGGGQVVGNDAALREMVCARYDAELASRGAADEEMMPHVFNSRTQYEPGDDRDIWCKDCEYHRDHQIHSDSPGEIDKECPSCHTLLLVRGETSQPEVIKACPQCGCMRAKDLVSPMAEVPGDQWHCCRCGHDFIEPAYYQKVKHGNG